MIEDIEGLIRSYLHQVLHLSLGTSVDNRPWVCELHFAYDEDLNLYFRSLPSRRHSQEIAQNPQVAGNIVIQHTITDPPQGIYFEGTCRRLTTDQERQAIIKHFERLNVGEAALNEANNPEGAQFYMIEVATYYIFDARESKPSQKYELPWKRS